MLATKNNRGRKTELIRTELIQIIRESKLKIGDKLPTQADLRKRLGVGNVTISRAVQALQEDGILDIKPREGIFLADPDADGYLGRNVGLACMRLTNTPANTSMLQCLELQLHDHGCQPVSFLRDSDVSYEKDTLMLFRGLRRSILQRRIDGLIATVTFDDAAWDFFEENEFPVCGSGVDLRQRYGVFIDFEYIITTAVEHVAKCGARRPALICCGYPLTNEFRNYFIKAARPLLETSSAEPYINILRETMDVPSWSFNQDISALLDQYLAISKEKRPDALIVPDDFLVQALHIGMLKKKTDEHGWNPRIIYLCNKQIPFLSNIPNCDYFLMDIMAKEKMVVEYLLSAIRKEQSAKQRLFYKPEFIIN